MSARQALLDRLVDALTRDERVVAVWIDGSLGRGVGDEHSDVDVGLAAEDHEADAIAASLPALARGACDAVLVQTKGRLVNVVTRDWDRIDLFVRARSEITAIPGPVTVVYDPTSSVRAIDAEPPPVSGRFLALVEEFIRFLGLLPVARHREEWVGAYIATGAMVGMLTELMQLENGTHRIGGALRLRDRLTESQRAQLRSVPVLAPDMASVTEVQVALARLFLTRARRVAESHGIAYPNALEAAVLRHLRRFGVEVPERLPAP